MRDGNDDSDDNHDHDDEEEAGPEVPGPGAVAALDHRREAAPEAPQEVSEAVNGAPKDE